MNRRKSELLRAVDRALLWERLRDYFLALELRLRHGRNLRTARELERRGML